MRRHTLSLTVLSFACGAVSAQAVHVPSVLFNGDGAQDNFGRSVGFAGDVDGDGHDDVIVGAPFDDRQGKKDRGSAWVYSGATGLALHVIYGDSAYDHFGVSVAGAGDVDGDGYDDFVVGADRVNSAAPLAGRVRVYSGRTREVLHTFDGDSIFDFFGSAVAGAGDVDGDGFADVIVGALFDDNDGGSEGSARVFSGATGAVLHVFIGDSPVDHFGVSVAGAGDVDGDGFDDVIVGARDDDNNGTDSGSARVFSGATGAVLYTFLGDDAFDHFGDSVAGAGDVDGDGFADLIVGAGSDDNNGLNSGSARVFSGRNGVLLHEFNGDSADDRFGSSVAGAGDIDGDGRDDVVVGAFFDDNNGRDAGSIRALSGATGAILHTFNGDAQFDNLGHSVAGGGDINGDGVPDLIAGAPSNDAHASNAGRVRVYASVTCAADIDGDGFIDETDLSFVLASFGRCVGDDGYVAGADVDGDGCVDLADLNMVVSGLNTDCL